MKYSLSPAIVLLILACFVGSAAGQVILPSTGRLAGPLNAELSQFGDEFVNFPFGTGSGFPPLRGWIEIEFGPVVDDTAEFRVFFNAIGEDEFFVFEDGHFYGPVGAFQAYNSGVQVSKGTLNLETREVETIEIHAVFLNSVIHQIARNNRFPLASFRKEGFFSPLNSDYPGPPLPVELPFDERPNTFEDAQFLFDSSGRITGFDFAGQGFAPVSILPKVAFFPGYSFGDNGQFYFLAPDGCLPGTTPPEECTTKETEPDGVPVPEDGYLHPSFDLVSTELREVGAERSRPDCLPEEVAGAGSATLQNGDIYVIGGVSPLGISDRVLIYSTGSGCCPGGSSNRWYFGPRMPLALVEAGVAAVGDRIYVVGGTSAEGRPVNRALVLDTETLLWGEIIPPPVPVTGSVTAAVGDKIYVLGGTGPEDEAVDHVQIYDPATNSWSSGTRMPVATSGSASAVRGSDVYVINGSTSQGEVTRLVWRYSTTGDSWSEGPSTQWGVYEGEAAYLDDRIYLVGGRREVGGPVDTSELFFNQQRIQVLEFLLDEWVQGIETPFATAHASLAVANSEIRVIGGYVGSASARGTPGAMIQVYDPARGWDFCGSQPLFSDAHVVNAAGLGATPKLLSPGGLGVVTGQNFSDGKLTAPLIRSEGNLLTSDLPKTLKGVTVAIDGRAAPILSVAPDRVEFQVPYEIQASAVPRTVKLRVTKEGASRQALAVDVLVVRAAPGIFTYSHGETRALAYLRDSAAIVRNADGRLNYPSQPARQGEIIKIRTSGLGAVQPSLETGRRAPADVPRSTVLKPVVYIGGVGASVVSTRLVQAEVGVYEITAVVPEEAPTGNLVPIQIQVDDRLSNRGKVAVR